MEQTMNLDYSLQDLVRCYNCDIPGPLMFCENCNKQMCCTCQSIHLSDKSRKHNIRKKRKTLNSETSLEDGRCCDNCHAPFFPSVSKICKKSLCQDREKKELSNKSKNQERQASKREKNNPKLCVQSSTFTCSQCCLSKEKNVHELDINSVRSEEKDNVDRKSPKSDETTFFKYQNIHLLISTLLMLFFVLYFMFFIIFEIMTNKI